MSVNLGDVCEDVVTGFNGVAVCVSRWLHGCERVTLQPPVGDDGKLPETATFDAPQLRVIVAGHVAPGSLATGGPRPEPTRR